MTTVLSILILNFNTKDLTLSCIRSIIKYYEKQIESGEFEILVGDNASKDGSYSFLKKEMQGLANVFIYKNLKNLGFAGGINLFSQKAQGKYLLFLNSDAKFINNDLTKAITFLDNNLKAGVLGLKMMAENGSVQLTSGKFYNLANLILMLLGGEKLGLTRFSPKETQEVDWVSGGSLVIRRDLYNKLNGFDENFFMYVEDMELCFRVKKLGFNIYFFPNCAVVHKEQGSSSRTYAILNIYEGILYFYKKHYSKLNYMIAKILFKVKAAIAILIGILTRNTYLINTYKQILYKL